MLNALNSRNLIEIFVFGIGAVIGILGFSKLLNYLLEKYESATMAFLIGIMLGTLRLPIMKITAHFFTSSYSTVEFSFKVFLELNFFLKEINVADRWNRQ